MSSYMRDGHRPDRKTMFTVSRIASLAFIFAFAAMASLATLDDAEARRAGGGGFGSRGTRTFAAPPVTQTAPTQAAPIQRTMTPQPQTAPQMAPQPGLGAQRPGMFSGFGRSMIGGLIVGGLFGMLLGQGFGGGFGFLGMLLQILLIGGAVMWAIRYFASRRQPGAATAHTGNSFGGARPANTSFRVPTIGASSSSPTPVLKRGPDEIGIGRADFDRFEQLLTQIQTAYGTEDYGAIRALTTPEAMSYLAEELGENATNGVRNSVSDVHLLQGDLAEAWREDSLEYATLAMRYSSIDAMVDRATGRLVDGDNRNPSEATELWTFVRKPGTDWKLSAIQGTDIRRAS
jgi:predicted lipid-binding transport protein (Tim44 family)